MHTLVLHRGFLFVCLLVTIAQSETASKQPQVVLIPLNEICAYDMPGTRKIGELDAVKEPTGTTAHPIVRQIVLALASRRPKEAEDVGQAFIVSTTGEKAVQDARDVITKSVVPRTKFSPETDLTLFFYSVLGAPYARIASVEKSERVITVKYRFVSHNTRDDTLHLA